MVIAVFDFADVLDFTGIEVWNGLEILKTLHGCLPRRTRSPMLIAVTDLEPLGVKMLFSVMKFES